MDNGREIDPSENAVLITGVSTGIGYDAVRFLVEKGYFVFGSVRNEEAQARMEQTFSPCGFRALVFDVTDKSAIDAARRQVQQTLGGRHLRALVNNAGLAVAGPLQLLDDDKFKQQIDVCLYGVRNVTNAFLPLLGARPDLPNAPHHHDLTGPPGKIINISSISGILNTPMNGAYCVAKHALESLGEVYRRELMGYGIDVVSIRPGPIKSCIWDKNLGTSDAYLGTGYRTMAAASERLIRQARKDALPAEIVSRLILEVIETRRPKCAYIVDKNKWMPALLANWLPVRFVDRLIWKAFNSGTAGNR